MRLLLAPILTLSLAACSEEALSPGHLIGSFCAEPRLFGSDERTYQLILSPEGRNRYRAFDEAAQYKFDRSGSYRIYDGSPVQRVELIGLCFSADNHACLHKNIGYPAEVVAESGKVRIVEDASGAPLALTKGSCEADLAMEEETVPAV